MNSSILRATTIIIAILGFIGGIILGARFKVLGESLYEEKFNIALMFEAWIGVIMYSLPLFAISQSLENQERIMNTLNNHENKLKNLSANTSPESTVPPTKNTKMNLSAIASSSNSDDKTWHCKNCGEKNLNVYRTCKSCGQDK